MAEEPKATPEHVPDVVLEELLKAFSEREAEGIDFDDPAIDHLLGLADSADSTAPTLTQVSDGLSRPSPAKPGAGAKEAPQSPPEQKPTTKEIGVTEIGVTERAPSTTSPGSPEPEAPKAPNAKGTLIVIGDDDLPDALYLDEESSSRLRDVHAGEGDDTGGRSTIVISDLDESGGIEALPARSSGSMDPRVRARRIAVRRAKGRKRLIWVAVAAATLLVLVGLVAVLASSLFDVRTIDVQGVVYTNQDQLSAVVDDLRGDAILLVDTRKVERELEKIAWVESARVSTHFPHEVLIDIRERKPIATFAGSDGKFRVIDRDGRVLDVLDGLPVDYMLVTGVNPDVDQGQFAGRPLASAAQLTIALPAEIRSLTESIGVDATAGNLTITFHEGLEVKLGPATDLSAKLVRLLSEVRGGLDGVCELDVTTGDIARTTCV